MTRRRILIEYTDEESTGDTSDRFEDINADLRRMEEGINQPIRVQENGTEVRLDSYQRYSSADEEQFRKFAVLIPRLFDYFVYDGEIPEWKREGYREETELFLGDTATTRISELLVPSVRRELFPETTIED